MDDEEVTPADAPEPELVMPVGHAPVLSAEDALFPTGYCTVCGLWVVRTLGGLAHADEQPS